MKAYRIKNWNKIYEVAQSRKLKKATWVAMPVELGGKGIQYMSEHRRGAELFGAWTLMVRLAASMPVRGILVSKSGRPLTVKDIAYETRFPIELFEFALPELCKPTIGWLEKWETDGEIN